MRQLAKAADYEARFGLLSEDERKLVEELLSDASELVLEAVSSSTKGWVSDEEESVPRGVVFTCVSMVRRELQGGDGIAREQLGEYAVSYRSNGPQNLKLTRHERRIVRRAAGLASALSVELESPYSGKPPLADMDFEFPLEEEGS